MRINIRSLLSFYLHSLVAAALVVSAVTLSAEVGSAAFVSRAALAGPGNSAATEPLAAKASISTYRWNLSDNALPLISLPDHIGGSLDLSLTYSLGQFEFPLFQTLYYNSRAGKYILLVIPKEDRSGRTTFIDLDRAGNGAQFVATGKSGLQLTDKGEVKLLTTKDGTVYTFASFSDGELHCSQITDRDGIVINFRYAPNASLETITDRSGRTIKFEYTQGYVSSITQTWKANSARLKQTWAIADEVRFAHRPTAYVAPSAVAMMKHVPSNAIKPTYTEAMVASDLELAAIFGGPTAVAGANGFEPARLGMQYPLYRGDQIGDDGRLLRGHLSFAMHLYGSSDGRGETAVYVPLGFTTHSKEPGRSDAAVTFYYPRLGNLTNVTLAVFHVANFGLCYEGERVRIGNIGGPGGSVASYRHSHLEFYRGNTGLPPLSARTYLRIDPATVFASKDVRY